MKTDKEVDKKRQENRLKEKTAGRVNQLVNDVENYTRTERHLEQHSDIGDPDRLKNAIGIQKEREEEINHLKDRIVHGAGNTTGGSINNLKENFEDTNEYMANYADHLNKKDLENLQQKQKNRLESMNQMDIK